MSVLISLVVSLLDGLAYRFRGGGFITTNNSMICRLVWSAVLTISYLAIGAHNIVWLYVPIIFITSFVGMLNMGFMGIISNKK